MHPACSGARSTHLGLAPQLGSKVGERQVGVGRLAADVHTGQVECQRRHLRKGSAAQIYLRSLLQIFFFFSFPPLLPFSFLPFSLPSPPPLPFLSLFPSPPPTLLPLPAFDHTTHALRSECRYGARSRPGRWALQRPRRPAPRHGHASCCPLAPASAAWALLPRLPASKFQGSAAMTPWKCWAQRQEVGGHGRRRRQQ